MLNFFKGVATFILGLLFLGVVAGGLVVMGVFYYFGRDLPDYSQLAKYEPPITTRVYAGDGQLMAEYAIENRNYVPLEVIPKTVVDAFLSAEDKSFFEHPGVDFQGVLRAILTNAETFITKANRRPVGASTITQQVAKNFLLTNEVSAERKIKEAILAFRIEKAYSKEHILELYLNEIYLGGGAYGVAAAALRYFDKPVSELSLAEAAYLAALPKAPNNYHPIRQRKRAVERRNWVLSRMFEDGRITETEYKIARDEPLTASGSGGPRIYKGAEFFVEDVRREILSKYGEQALYKGGLAVRSTVDPRLQEVAVRTLREGLIDYDRRHGWRGPVARIDLAPNGQPLTDPQWRDALTKVARPAGAGDDWRMALVLASDKNEATLGFTDGRRGPMPLAEVKWARAWKENQRLGPEVKAVTDVVAPGDVVLVEPTKPKIVKGKPVEPPEPTFSLVQIPDVEGSLVALDPHTGRVLAMVGGFAPDRSEFNRASQALRQPGSSFKPFVYLAALDNGFTPSSLILDAPFVLKLPGQPIWKPDNYDHKFDGPTTLRRGIEKSRNLMTVRLANFIGMGLIADYAERFGITEDLNEVLAMSLGAAETTALRMTAAYAMLVNGGKRVTPTLIDRIQNRRGETIYRHDERPCPSCKGVDFNEQPMPEIPDMREQLTDPVSAYQMVSILQGVVCCGTAARPVGSRLKGIPLAGKTGTSNDAKDTWFVGFAPDLAVGVFVGFDDPRTLGRGETGGSVAAPIFASFMEAALEGKKAVPFRAPRGVKLVRVSRDSGQRYDGEGRPILEVFKSNEDPESGPAMIGGNVDDDYEGEILDPNSGFGPSVSATGSVPRAGEIY